MTAPYAFNLGIVPFHAARHRDGSRTLGAAIWKLADHASLLNLDAYATFLEATHLWTITSNSESQRTQRSELNNLFFNDALFENYPQIIAPPNPPFGLILFEERRLKHVTLHEFGHMVGLQHTNPACAQAGSVMYRSTPLTSQGAQQQGFVYIFNPTANDRAGIDKLYKRQ